MNQRVKATRFPFTLVFILVCMLNVELAECFDFPRGALNNEVTGEFIDHRSP